MECSETSTGCKMNKEPKHINSLPDEILLKILRYLPLSDLIVSASDVCTRWKALSHDRKLWRGKTLDLPEDDSVQYVAECFPGYKTISVELSQYPWTGKAMFEAKQLHAFVRTKECFFSFLQTIIRNGEIITDISICGINENVEAVLTLVSYLPNLQRLSIDGSFFTENSGIRHLADRCPLLTDVDTGEVSFTDVELKFFLDRKCHQLTHLGLSVQTGEGSLISRFLHVCCETLTSLDIYGIAGFYLTLVDDITVFGEMKKLEQLELHSYIKFGEGVLANAFKSGWFETLKILVIDNGTFVDDEVMTAISLHCPQLCELQVNNSHFSGRGLQHLHHMKNLKKLDLSFSQLMRTVGTLSQCTQLRELNLESCTILSPQELGATVPCLRELRHLDLSHCRTSALQLQELSKHLPFLSVLVIYNTRVNAEKIQILRQRAPHIRIVV